MESRTPWTSEEKKMFKKAILIFLDPSNNPDWAAVTKSIPGRTAEEVEAYSVQFIEEFVGQSNTSGCAAVTESIPGRTAEEVEAYSGQLLEDFDKQVEDLPEIESGQVELPSSTNKKDIDPDKRMGVRWTTEEHRLFLEGIQKFGKGDWKNISRVCVKSKTPSQVSSHAQKFFLRHNGDETKSKRRSSIHDSCKDEFFKIFGK